MEVSEVKKALLDRAEDVCRHLFPNGKRERVEWKCGKDDRLANGDGGHSLCICLAGDKAGIWHDHGGTSGGNNLLELWIQKTGQPFKDALADVKKWLGDKGGPTGLRDKPKKAYAKPTKKGITRIKDKAFTYLTIERGIPEEIVALYKICMTKEMDAIVFPYLDDACEPQMLKFLKLERDENGKKLTWTTKDTAKVLFGKHTRRPEDRTLLITEGEIDAMSWRSLRMPGVCVNSLPFGAKWESEKTGQDPNQEWIDNDWDYLESFEWIVLFFDMDEEGRKASASVVKRLGLDRTKVGEMPLKDGNECWMAGLKDEMVAAFAAAKTVDPAELRNASHYADKVIDMFFNADENTRRGIPLPFGAYQFHLRWNEWTVVSGFNGSGKTQVLGWILCHLRSLGWCSCVASLEVTPAVTLQYYVMQVCGSKRPDRDKAKNAIDWLSQGMWFFDHVGEVDWKKLLESFRYAYRRYGVRFFVIDSWMKLGIAGDDYDAQGDAANAFTDFVRDLPVHLFVVVHSKKKQNERERSGKMDIKGSGEITDQSHNVCVVWRNKDKELQIEKMVKMEEAEARINVARRAKPDAVLKVEKQRNGDGDEPTIDMWFHKESKQFWGHYRSEPLCLLNEPASAPPPDSNPHAADGGADAEDYDQPF